MDPATAFITGGIAIVAAAVPQIIQAVRATSEHGHELRRDHAQRVFAYKEAKLLRVREACIKLFGLTFEVGVFGDDVIKLQRQKENLQERAQQLRELQAHASDNEMEEINIAAKALILSAQELNSARDDISKRHTEITDQIIEIVNALSLEAQGEDFLSLFRRYLQERDKDPKSDVSSQALRDFTKAIERYVKEVEEDLLRAPLQTEGKAQ